MIENFEMFLSFPPHSGNELCASVELQNIKTIKMYKSNFFISIHPSLATLNKNFLVIIIIIDYIST